MEDRRLMYISIVETMREIIILLRYPNIKLEKPVVGATATISEAQLQPRRLF